MKSEYRIFLGVAAFLAAMSVIYWFWTKAALGHYDYAGTIALAMTTLLCVMCGGYFWFVSRRIDPRPEDRLDGEIADAAGEVGFFAPGSYWPFGIGLATAAAGLGLVFTMWWLVAVGLIGCVVGGSAMLFEFYTGTRRTAEH